jgi:prepilin-type N-terminal cleavage/methylation domain-containing protein
MTHDSSMKSSLPLPPSGPRNRMSRSAQLLLCSNPNFPIPSGPRNRVSAGASASAIAYPIPRKHPGRHHSAFTLIELLVVMAIIALIAGLIVPLAGIASTKGKLSRARAQLGSVGIAIDNYKSKNGYYPPDNQGNPYTNQLFYELRGMQDVTPAGSSSRVFSNLFMAGETISANSSGSGTIQRFFGPNTGGFVNSSPDPTLIQNFYRNLKPTEIVNINTAAQPVWIFAFPAKGPTSIQTSIQGPVNPVCYVSSNPTNNPNSYDLWIDMVLSGKTQRVCNWSPETIAVH